MASTQGLLGLHITVTNLELIDIQVRWIFIFCVRRPVSAGIIDNRVCTLYSHIFLALTQLPPHTSSEQGPNWQKCPQEYLHGILYEWPSQLKICKNWNISNSRFSSLATNLRDKWLKFYKENLSSIFVLKNLWNYHHKVAYNKDKTILHYLCFYSSLRDEK